MGWGKKLTFKKKQKTEVLVNFVFLIVDFVICLNFVIYLNI